MCSNVVVWFRSGRNHGTHASTGRPVRGRWRVGETRVALELAHTIAFTPPCMRVRRTLPTCGCVVSPCRDSGGSLTMFWRVGAVLERPRKQSHRLWTRARTTKMMLRIGEHAAHEPLRSQPRPYVVLCCAIVLFGWLDVAHGADIYRWKDANDVTTFSQLPPDHAVYVERLRRHDREESSTSGTMPNTASTLGSWQVLLPPTARVEPMQDLELAGIRLAETPAEQELNERLEAAALVNEPSRAPRQALQSRWVEVIARPQRGARR